MKRLLIINNQDSFTYNLVDMIRRLAVPFDVVNVQELDVDEVANYSHILISLVLMCHAPIRNCLRCWNATTNQNPF